MTIPKINENKLHVFAANCDLNGCLRGKMYTASMTDKLLKSGMRMPMSSIGVDIWGQDVIGASYVLEQGDLDGICLSYQDDALPIHLTKTCHGIIPTWMFREDGSPFLGDPRQALAHVLTKYEKLGLKPVVATELEFYLVDPAQERATPISGPRGKPVKGDQIYSINQLSTHSSFFDDVYRIAEECGIMLETAISEGGQGQFEFNLLHIDDPLKAADHAVYFKQIVKLCAQNHGISASFMAKPYLDMAGCGFHMHFSLLDKNQHNVFDDGTEKGTIELRHAIAGLIDSMQEMVLVFAPHKNSYRRLARGSLAPTKALWGYENRTVAVRVPGGPNAARRIEHRVAGADANPYLVIAAVLGAALVGIEEKRLPSAPIVGNAYDCDGPQLTPIWADAIELFRNGKISNAVFDPMLISSFTACKIQELVTFGAQFPTFEYQSYLDVV